MRPLFMCGSHTQGFPDEERQGGDCEFPISNSCVRPPQNTRSWAVFLASEHPSRLWKDTIDHGRCPFTRLHANLESHQSFERSSLSSVYRPRGLGCLACTGSDDRKGP